MHGLAYLGVLLVFAGVFGFVAFAYGDVQAGLRPVAELTLPVAFLGAAWVLRRRGVTVVSAALELLGGGILPIVLIASMADGASPPPDLEGMALVAALTIGLLLVAGVYLVVSLRRPASALRFLVGPTAWLAVAAAGLLLAPSIPWGADLIHPVPAQWALVGVAITITLLVSAIVEPAPSSPGAVLVRAITTSALPAVAVAELVTVLAAAGQGWPVGAIAAAGAATIVSLDLLGARLDARLDARLVLVLQAATLYATGAALAPAFGPAPSASIVVLGVLVLFEWYDAQARDVDVAIVLGSLVPGAAVGLLVAVGQPGPALVACGVTWLWATARRLRPARLPLPAPAIAAVIALTSLGAFSGLAGLTTVEAATVAAAAVVLIVAAATRLTRNRDLLWAVWIPAVAILDVAATVNASSARMGWAAGAAGLAAVALAIAPRWPVIRAWTSTIAALVAVAATCAALGWAPTTNVAVFAGVAIALVVGAAWRNEHVAGHVGLIGHLTALAAVVGAFSITVEPGTAAVGWDLAEVTRQVAFGAWTVGWIVTAAAQTTRGSSVADLLDRAMLRLLTPAVPPYTSGVYPSGAGSTRGSREGAGDHGRQLAEPVPMPAPHPVQAGATAPALVATVSLPVWIGAILVAVGAIPVGSAWELVAIVAVVLAEAILARAVSPSRQRLGMVLAHGGFVVALAAFALTVDDHLASAVAAGLVIASVVAVGPIVRRAYMEWVAWAASALLALSLALVLGVAEIDLRSVILVWGEVALVGSLGFDDLRHGRRAPNEILRDTRLRPGVVLGASALTGGLLALSDRPPTVSGCWYLGTAAVLLVVAWQLHWGGLSALSLALATAAYAALAPWHPVEVPWTLVPLVAAMVLLAEGLQTLGPVTRAPGRRTSPISSPADEAPGDGPESLEPPERAPADLIRGRGDLPSWLLRWDLAPLVVAHGVAAVALAASLENGWIPATWCATGALALALDARRRTGAWAAGGTLVVLVGAGAAGWGWLSLALVVTSGVSTLIATRVREQIRPVYQATAVVAAGASWASLLAWQQVDLARAATLTATATTLLALTLAVVMGVRRIGRNWLIAWSALLPAGAVFVLLALTDRRVPPDPTATAFAGTLVALAVWCGAASYRFRAVSARAVSAGLVIAAGASLGYGVQADAAQVAGATAFVGLLASMAVTAVIATDAAAAGRLTAWSRPAVGPWAVEVGAQTTTATRLARATHDWLGPTAIVSVSALVTATVAGAVAGPGWLALVLAELTLVTTGLAFFVRSTARVPIVAIGVVAAVPGWIALADAQHWTVATSTQATAAVVGVLALVLAAALRLPTPDRRWAGLWAGLVPGGLVFCTAVLLGGTVPRWPTGAAVAGALTAAALASAIAAAPAGLGWLRETAAVLLATAGLVLGFGLTATATQIVAVAGTVGILATLVVSTMTVTGRNRPAGADPWIRPILVLAAIATVATALTALAQWPERPLLVAALLLLGLDLTALGLTGRRPLALVAAPVPIGAAWLVFASEALTGNPQWFTVPAGLTLLAVVGLTRVQERRTGHDPASAPIVVLDLLGSALIVGGALALTVVDNVAYGLLAIALGATIAVWGVLTKVRRRVVFGATTITLAVLLLVVVPLAGLIPHAGGPALWLALAGVGLVAITVAALLEQGRALAHRAITGFRDATEGWEGWSTHPHPPASSGI